MKTVGFVVMTLVAGEQASVGAKESENPPMVRHLSALGGRRMQDPCTPWLSIFVPMRPI